MQLIGQALISIKTQQNPLQTLIRDFCVLTLLLFSLFEPYSSKPDRVLLSY
jgi:hypothetical protein